MSNATVTKNLIRGKTCYQCKYYKFDLVNAIEAFAGGDMVIKNECCRRLIAKMRLPKKKTCKWWIKEEWDDPDWPRT